VDIRYHTYKGHPYIEPDACVHGLISSGKYSSVTDLGGKTQHFRLQ